MHHTCVDGCRPLRLGFLPAQPPAPPPPPRPPAHVLPPAVSTIKPPTANVSSAVASAAAKRQPPPPANAPSDAAAQASAKMTAPHLAAAATAAATTTAATATASMVRAAGGKSARASRWGKFRAASKLARVPLPVAEVPPCFRPLYRSPRCVPGCVPPLDLSWLCVPVRHRSTTSRSASSGWPMALWRSWPLRSRPSTRSIRQSSRAGYPRLRRLSTARTQLRVGVAEVTPMPLRVGEAAPRMHMQRPASLHACIGTAQRPRNHHQAIR